METIKTSSAIQNAMDQIRNTDHNWLSTFFDRSNESLQLSGCPKASDGASKRLFADDYDHSKYR
jgi:hypothetical protein